MRSVVKMPRVADTVDECVVTELLVQAGETVKEGDPLMTVDTDKASTEVPSPVQGTVLEWLIGVEDEVSTGDPIVAIDRQ